MRGSGAAIVVLLVVGCSPERQAPAPRLSGGASLSPHPGGHLRLAIVDEIVSLDPAVAFDEFSILALHLQHDTLLDYASASSADPLQLVPSLAEGYTISDDGLVYRFVLRPGLAYADGRPLVADDFVHALERVLTPTTSSPGASFYLSIAGAREVLEGRATRVVGLVAHADRELSITLERPDALLPMLLALPFSAPVPRGANPSQPPSSGPFYLVEHTPGQRLRLRRNPHYHRADLPRLDEISIEERVSRAVGMLKFFAGELDMLDRLSADDYVRIARAPAWGPFLVRSPQLGVNGQLLNVRVSPLDDRRVRQALNYAVNKEDLVRIANGRALVAHGILPPALLGHDAALAPYPYDPERARQLLAEAGFPRGFDLTYSTTSDEQLVLEAQSLQADLAQVGVRVRLQILTAPAYFGAAGRGQIAFGYTGWIADFPDGWDFLASRFGSASLAPENASNDTGYASAELDALIAQAREEADRDRRAELYRRAERLLYEDCPWIWQTYPVQVELLQPRVRGYLPHPVWTRNVREVWLDPESGGAGP